MATESESNGMPDDPAAGVPASGGPDRSADLRLTKLRIAGFRGIDDMAVEFSSAATFLVGENNAGKTSVLHALAVAFGARQPVRDDLLRKGDVPANEATVDVFLSPAEGPAFDEATRQRLQAVQREAAPPRREVVAFRTTLTPSNEGNLLGERRQFLQPQGDDWVVSSIAFQPQVLRLVEVHLLDASRDLIAELGSQTSTWGRVVSDLKIPSLPDLNDGSPDPNGRAGLESDLGKFARRLREASPVLGQLEKDLMRLTRTQNTVGKVELVALPPRIEELARTIEVVISQRDKTSLPLRFHGLGSRSLAALLVFQTMCSLRVGQDRGVKPHLITLLEEPEAHLHPQAIVALRDVISHLEGQALVTTHSPQLVAELDPAYVRVIRRTIDGSRSFSIPQETAKKLAQFRRFVERPYGEIFFARLVVFGDGTSERNALPVLVAPVLRADPASLGITFIDCESMGDPKVAKAIDALHHLGTPWLVFADNDADGANAVSKIVDPATKKPLTFSHSAVISSGRKQIETLLIDAGYLSEIDAVAQEAGKGPIADDGAALKFLKKEKGWAAEAVARSAVAAGKPAPPPIEDLAKAITRRLGLVADV